MRTKASELVCNFPIGIQCCDGFTLRLDLTAGSNICNGEVHYCNLYNVVMTRTWRHLLTSNPRLSAKNTPLFLFPQMGHSLQIFVKLCPYILMYSALHIMQWFSHSLDVFTPKIKRKFFDFYIL